MSKLARKAGLILPVLANKMVYFKKLYTFPSQEKLLQWLSQTVHLNISRATLNRDLKHIEIYGLIKRTRRHYRCKFRGMVFRSTLYEITQLGWIWLRDSGHITWKQLQKIRSAITTHKQPQKKPPVATQPPGELDSLQAILKKAGLVPG